MIDVKAAVAKAMAYLGELYDTSKFREILLEEVEKSPDDKFWLVTLGYSRPLEAASTDLLKAIAPAFGVSTKYTREYKVFAIDANNGEVRSMKIRELTSGTYLR